MIEVYGLTTDGKPLVRGLYRFYETTGLPLSMVIDNCLREGWMPGWLSLAREMEDAGVKNYRARIVSAVEESEAPAEVKLRVRERFTDADLRP